VAEGWLGRATLSSSFPPHFPPRDDMATSRFEHPPGFRGNRSDRLDSSGRSRAHARRGRGVASAMFALPVAVPGSPRAAPNKTTGMLSNDLSTYSPSDDERSIQERKEGKKGRASAVTRQPFVPRSLCDEFLGTCHACQLPGVNLNRSGPTDHAGE